MEIKTTLWSPPVRTDRVVVVHDGPDYERYGGIVAFSEQAIATGRLPAYHLALLSPDDRLEEYSANPAYAHALAERVLPRIGRELGTDRPVIGVGASLGALAMLHAQRRHPHRFAGLLLQSGSFFQPRFDRQESGFARWLRIVRFTGRVIRATGGPGVPIALTCGTVEENLANNRDMARALARQGYAVEYAEVPGGHDWEAWRAALDPHFAALVTKVYR
ncbi:esterase family protein [Actinoplanes sp. N902-109]|uniref:alpha/beta hydrolase n=1 Tax=Actinoplanes sp. (strain N902-109) TaxID=649831 RepID=UPI0003294897|nr:alpha/beta hydrolase-fold protein [Actinoplanes sp. N902-109]AGL18362.1 putative esterase [Actinoplanes sp. N902-109]